MKKYILFILSLIILNADETIKIDIKANCTDTQEYLLNINSPKLHLTKNAVQENIDGYVDIADNKYYFGYKDQNTEYVIDGTVENLNKEKVNQFSGYITLNELNTLRASNQITFTQDINLVSRIKNVKTTLDVYFDKTSFDREHVVCMEQMYKQEQNKYLKTLFFIPFILIVFYLVKRGRRAKSC
ncbi:hypothetical protein N9A28_08195 [Sulfurimonas sp.]|nr:hypothetical protein [Sulfurimonas sp.]